jgi:hypothetical protein
MTKEQEDALLDAPKPAKCYGVNPANDKMSNCPKKTL